MNKIIYPICKKAFKVDEAGFAYTLKQVRDHKFDEELAKRLELAENDKQITSKLVMARNMAFKMIKGSILIFELSLS